MRASVAATLVLALIALLAGCSSSGGNSGSGFVAGKWTALLTVGQLGMQPEFDMNFTLSGNTISSDNSNTLATASCNSPQSISSTGTVGGGNFKVVYTIDTETVTVNGTVGVGGKTVTATFTSSGGPCLMGDSGTFAANFVEPVTGTYTGTLTDSNNNTVSNVTAMMSENSNFEESATMMVTNNVCLSTLATQAGNPGMSIGGVTAFDVSDGTNTVDFIGRVNSAALLFLGQWKVTAGCTDQEGSVTMSSAAGAAIRSSAGSNVEIGGAKISPQLVERVKALLARKRAG